MLRAAATTRRNAEVRPLPRRLFARSLAVAVHFAFFELASSSKPMWSYVTPKSRRTFGAHGFAERMWDRGFLDRGYTAAHLEQMVPVIERLQAGLPITVVGLGSSIMSDHGGCYYRDASLLGPGYPRFRGSKVGPCEPFGFVGGFMTELNRSYPHPDHVFVNLGKAGTDLEFYARRNCFGAEMPGEIDLIVIDQHEWERPGSPANPSSPRYVRGGRYLEEIWVQIQSHGRSADTAPAVFVVSTGYTLDVNELGPKKLTKEEDTHLHRCIWSCAYDKELVPTCGDFKANGFFIYAQHAVGGGAVEDFHSRVLHWYGMAEFSLRNMMVSAIRDDLWDTTECLLVALFWEDKIHPSREHGHLLIADALMRYVERAEQFAAGTRPALRRMERPFMPVADGAWDVPARLCFTLDENGGIPVDKNGTATAPGWNLTDEGRHKWGWVSTTAGARLVVPLDVLALPGAAAGPVELTVTYLQSYEGVGVAKYGCSGGCSCNPGEINPLRPSDKTSVDKYHTVRLNVSVPEDYEADTDTTDTVGAAGGASAAQDCVFTLTTVEEGKKFKLRALMLSTNTSFEDIAEEEFEQERHEGRRRRALQGAGAEEDALSSRLPGGSWGPLRGGMWEREARGLLRSARRRRRTSGVREQAGSARRLEAIAPDDGDGGGGGAGKKAGYR